MSGLQYETIQGEVVAKANHYQAVSDDSGHRRIIKDEKIRTYESCFRRQCLLYKSKGIDRIFKLHVKVFYSSMRYDLDNSLKTILDCLQMVGAIKNDNLCVAIIAHKFIDKCRPRVMFAIEEIEPRLL